MRLELTRLDWQVINDTVMGGRSRAAAEPSATGVRFSGNLSIENNGGFASIRAALPKPVMKFACVRLDFTGDGRDYQLRLRDTDDSDAVAWRARFPTSGRRESLELCMEDFEPVVRGRIVAVLPGLSERPTCFLGFMLTSRQPGPFTLVVHNVQFILESGQYA